MGERLQKIIAHAGIASRRQAERLIEQGQVTVNGKVVRKLGSQADPERDHIKVNGKLIRPESLEYWAVHKPVGMLSAVRDDRNRPVVRKLVPSTRRIYPAGRLDFNSEGLMILTNDGELARKIMQAGTLEKVYRVKIQGHPARDKLDLLRKGLRSGRVQYAPCKIKFLKKTENNIWFEIRLRQGKNRQIRKMFEAINHHVLRLKRIAVGPVRLGGLRPGHARKLLDSEVKKLKAA
ncbi:MAG TPA: pseudouridine synthase [Acidobacteriota bacterium]|nr:pseudouridine synthase [Acidobacteriota bacterium]